MKRKPAKVRRPRSRVRRIAVNEVVQVGREVFQITNRLYGLDGATLLCATPMSHEGAPVWIYTKPGSPARVMHMRGPTSAEWMNFRK